MTKEKFDFLLVYKTSTSTDHNKKYRGIW